MPQKCQVRFGGDIAFEIISSQKYANFNYQQAIDGNKSASFCSVFIDADHPTLTLEQKSGGSGDANQTYLWASPWSKYADMIDNEITIENDDWHLLIVTGFHKSQMDENQIYLDREDNIFQR